MTQRLILARHGNTFGPEDVPVWVGARTDLPLVKKGVAQALLVAEALKTANITPDSIIAGPLQRTRRMAEIIIDSLQISAGAMRVDNRLTEIDYGTWEGKSTEQIIAAGGADELEAWNKNSIFPHSPGWNPREVKILADTCAVLEELSDETSLIVSSNGILRFFARAALNAAEIKDCKVSTGHMCLVERDERGWRIVGWNQSPEQFPLICR